MKLLKGQEGNADRCNYLCPVIFSSGLFGQEPMKECAEAYQAALAVLLPSMAIIMTVYFAAWKGLAEAERLPVRPISQYKTKILLTCFSGYRTERGGGIDP